METAGACGVGFVVIVLLCALVALLTDEKKELTTALSRWTR